MHSILFLVGRRWRNCWCFRSEGLWYKSLGGAVVPRQRLACDKDVSRRGDKEPSVSPLLRTTALSGV